MAIHLSAPLTTELKPRIVVFGLGALEANAVNNMIEAGLEGSSSSSPNTDAQQLAFSKTNKRIQLGVTVTQGLGRRRPSRDRDVSGGESGLEIGEHLDGAHMVFITAGMGGGTGTGRGADHRQDRPRAGHPDGGSSPPSLHFGRSPSDCAWPTPASPSLQRYVDNPDRHPNQKPVPYRQ